MTATRYPQRQSTSYSSRPAVRVTRTRRVAKPRSVPKKPASRVYRGFGGVGRFVQRPLTVPPLMTYASQHIRYGIGIRRQDYVNVDVIPISALVAQENLPFITGIYGRIHALDSSTIPVSVVFDIISAPAANPEALGSIWQAPADDSDDPRYRYSQLYQEYSTTAHPVLDSRQATLLHRSKLTIPPSAPGALTVNPEGRLTVGPITPREVFKNFAMTMNRSWSEGPGVARQQIEKLYLVLHVHTLFISTVREIEIDYRVGFHSH